MWWDIQLKFCFSQKFITGDSSIPNFNCNFSGLPFSNVDCKNSVICQPKAQQIYLFHKIQLQFLFQVSLSCKESISCQIEDWCCSFASFCSAFDASQVTLQE